MQGLDLIGLRSAHKHQVILPNLSTHDLLGVVYGHLPYPQLQYTIDE